MIILPDRNIPRAKILLPMPAAAWRTPSQAQAKNAIGHENVTWFLVEARRNGRLIARGFFDDREDFDTYIWAIATGNIRYDRYLRELPVPMLDPDLYGDEDVQYNFLTQVNLTTGASWTRPADCTGISGKTGEFVDVIGGGGSGGTWWNIMEGGGGGGWARITTLAMVGASIAMTIGLGGPAATAAYNTQNNGTAGTATFFSAAGTVQAGGGGAGIANNSTSPPVSGGAGGVFVAGASGFAGGRGGNVAGFGTACMGGGGAAGFHGAGGNGADKPGNSPPYAFAGGTGDAGNTAIGAAGAQYGAGFGCGGGANGLQGQAPGFVMPPGGNYGGGGAGGSVSSGNITSSAGGPGLIVIRYEPFIPPSAAGFNLAMGGM